MERAKRSEFNCPQCGAASPVAAGEVFVTCRFCDTRLYLDRSQVVGHYVLPRLLDRAQAQAALSRWMAGNDTVKDLDRKSRLALLEPIVFPVWLFRVRQQGAETVYTEPAAPTAISELADLEIPAGRLKPYNGPEEGAETLPSTVPLATARGWLEERGIGEVHESLLVDVPVWRAQYRYGNNEYEALVEASTGRVLAAVYPEKAESPYYLVAGLGLLLFGAEGLLISNLALKALAYLITAVPLALIAWWVTRKV